MKKGIVHMLEAILVSLTFLLIVPFLLYPFLIRTDWSYVQMSVNGQDLLSTLDRLPDPLDVGGEKFLQNIMGRNTSYLTDEITKNFRWLENRRINYGIETIGSIRNEIRVGVNCTDGAGGGCYNNRIEDEIGYLEYILRPAYINGRYVEFRVFPFSYDRMSRTKMDVILVRGEIQKNEANNRVDEIKSVFLERGTGIVGFYDAAPPANDDIETEIFGIKAGAVGDLSLGIDDIFINSDNASWPNYGIQKYFYGVGINQNFTYKWREENETAITLWSSQYWFRRNDTGCAAGVDWCRLDIDTDHLGTKDYDFFGKNEGYDFSITDPLGTDFDFEIEKIDQRGGFFVLNFDRGTPYRFETFENNPIRSRKSPITQEQYVLIETDTNKAAMVVNGSDETRWRAVWLSEEKSGDDINSLLKSALIWASDRSWWNVLRSVSGEHTKMSYFVSQGEDFYEPYWVELTLWYVY
ncbi:MAG: hypothetical protein JSV92_04385 [archaeon]|nr:MAG: hypothetical protein JSV92_04385 [archaeon]